MEKIEGDSWIMDWATGTTETTKANKCRLVCDEWTLRWVTTMNLNRHAEFQTATAQVWRVFSAK